MYWRVLKKIIFVTSILTIVPMVIIWAEMWRARDRGGNPGQKNPYGCRRCLSLSPSLPWCKASTCLFASICTQIILQWDRCLGKKLPGYTQQFPISLKHLISAGARWDQDLLLTIQQRKERGDLVFKTNIFFVRRHGHECVGGRGRPSPCQDTWSLQ